MCLNRGIKIQDERGALQAAEERGLTRGQEIGQKIGQEMGEQHKAREIARNLLRQGLTAPQIATATGLAEAEVAALAADAAPTA